IPKHLEGGARVPHVPAPAASALLLQPAECWSVSPSGESSSAGAAGNFLAASLSEPPSAPGSPRTSSGGASSSRGLFSCSSCSVISRSLTCRDWAGANGVLGLRESAGGDMGMHSPDDR